MSSPRRALVLSGGPHPFAETTPIITEILARAGYEVELAESPEVAADVLTERPPELWVTNTLRWRMLADKYDAIRSDFAYETSAGVRRAFSDHVRGGGLLLALHAAPICFDDWPGWGDIVGARWDWETSSHPPLGEVDVRMVSEHPLVAGLEDFTVVDEAYGRMVLASDVRPLAVSRWDGEDHPMVWARQVGRGWVVTSTLGHGRESLSNPVHRRLLRRSISWLGSSDHPGEPEAGQRSGAART